jgi:hypothetical protein
VLADILLSVGSPNGTLQLSSNAPGVPTGLSAVAPAPQTVLLSWTVSTGSAFGYHVRRDGVLIAAVAVPSYVDVGVQPHQSYSYTVDAFSAARYVSAQSAPATVTTPAPPIYGTAFLDDLADEAPTFARFGLADVDPAPWLELSEMTPHPTAYLSPTHPTDLDEVEPIMLTRSPGLIPPGEAFDPHPVAEFDVHTPDLITQQAEPVHTPNEVTEPTELERQSLQPW